MKLLLAIVLGAVAGRAVRAGTPYLLRLKDASRPFAWPWVELAGAAVFALLALRRGLVWERLDLFLFATLLLAVAATDVRARLIPDLLTLPGTVLGLAWNAAQPQQIASFLGQVEVLPLLRLPREVAPWSGLLLAAIGALLGFVLLEGFRRLIALLAEIEGMGMGDAKLLMMIGAFLGPHAVLLTLLPACAAGAVAGLFHRLLSGQPHVAFGPALAFGAVAVAVAGEPLLGALWRASLALLRLPRSLLVTFHGLLLALLVLVLWQLRRRAAHYSQLIEDDYRALDEELRDD